MKFRNTGVLTLSFYFLTLFLTTLTASSKAASQPSEQSYLYKAMFVRGAPGKLLELIDLYKNRI